MKRLGTTMRSEAPALAEGEGGALSLWVAASPDTAAVGHCLPLPTRPDIQLGREASTGTPARLVLDDERVSRLHATLLGDGRALRIADCRSSNGLYVDGQRVDQAALGPGSVIRLGDTLLVVAHGEAEEGDDLGLVGRSPALAALRRMIRKVAPSHLAVLVTGETGTGKERVAEAVHRLSGRRGPFVPINCAALPVPLAESILFGHERGAYTGATSQQQGAFAAAHGGTLFLDEVGELSLEVQPKLLRVLEDGLVTRVGASRPERVDTRIVSATNVPLDEAVASGRFRRDLHARLAGVPLPSPPLRQRREDIPRLLAHFLPLPFRARPLSADFAEALLLHLWPENIRELGKLADRLSLFHPMSARWELGMLDEPLRRRVVTRGVEPEGQRDEEGDRPPSLPELLALLDRYGGNVSLIAKHVRRNRKQVYRWMDELGVARGTGR
jgi:DNA-binding NtrC family response regulator